MIVGFALTAPVAFLLLWQDAPLLGLGLLMVSHLLLLYPTLRPNVQWLGPVATRFATSERQVWLTIDDGPAGDTPEVLDLFQRHGVRATFFVRGELAAAREELVAAILAAGHSVANHSHTHPAATFWCATPRRIAAEIDQCNEVLLAQTGITPQWFRAPVGMKNPFVHPVLRKRGMRLIGWTARGFDGVAAEPSRVVSRILPRVVPGAIIVLHQGHAHSLQVLEQTIIALTERGYSFVIPTDESLRS